MFNNATLINSTVGESKGKPRVWFEGGHVARSGIQSGEVLYVNFSDGKIEASHNEPESYDYKFKVSGRTNKKNGVRTPVVDLRHQEIDVVGHGEIRIAIRGGKVVIRHFVESEFYKEKYKKAQEFLDAGNTLKIADLFQIKNKSERCEEIANRLKNKIHSGLPLDSGEFFCGGGIMQDAIHSGFKRAGVELSTKFVNDIDRKFLGHNAINNCHLWSTDTVFIESPIEKIDFSKSGSVEIICAGIPCLGASLAGRSSLNLRRAEDHSKVGLAFVPLLQAIFELSPAIIQLENVTQYLKTDSMKIITTVLEGLGYNIAVKVLGGDAVGALEKRERMVMVATVSTLNSFDFEDIHFSQTDYQCVGDCLDSNIDEQSDRWKSYDYLKAKEIRDKKKGNNFARTILDQRSTSVPTIKRLNHKAQSDGIFIAHPTNQELSRLPTIEENSRFKTVPLRLINGLSETLGTEILGQGVIWKVFDDLGEAMGQTLKKAG